jgi:uncharacterized membrane protein YbjE (DUF340 family)
MSEYNPGDGWNPAIQPSAARSGECAREWPVFRNSFAAASATDWRHLTSIILAIELMGSFTLLSPMLGAFFAVMLVPTLLHNPPI